MLARRPKLRFARDDTTRLAARAPVFVDRTVVLERRTCRRVRLSRGDGAVRHGAGADEADRARAQCAGRRDRYVEFLAWRLVSLAPVLAVCDYLVSGRAARRRNHAAGYLLPATGWRGACLFGRALADVPVAIAA